jgi:hypothetical protein
MVTPTAYQLEKLATMNRENTAEVLALKAAAANAKPEDVLPLRTRALKLEKKIKAAARLERALGLHKKPPGVT